MSLDKKWDHCNKKWNKNYHKFNKLENKEKILIFNKDIAELS